MTCQHPGCERPATRMVGYRKWCGVDINVGAVCDDHVGTVNKMVQTILDSYPSGLATAYNRKART